MTTSTVQRYQAFISYARGDDAAFVERLHKDLSERGIAVWWDRKAMESRGRVFLQELRDAIEAVDRVIFVVGPDAVRSVYCRAELEHAYLFAKAVLPILRIGSFDLFPEKLAGLHAIDAREDPCYSNVLSETLKILQRPVARLGPLRNLVPALPPHFSASRPELARLSREVSADLHRPTVMGSSKQVVGLHGMGGAGKSVLAAAFARLTETRLSMKDGIVWVIAGRKAEALNLMQQVGLAFGEAPDRVATRETARASLPALLQDKVCLIIVDDAWDVQALAPLRNALGPRGRLLLTTRDVGVIQRLGGQPLALDEFTENRALGLLAEWSGVPRNALPPEASAIVEECGRLPLALAMVGAAVRGKPERWKNQLHRLQSSDLERIRQELPDYPYPDLARSIEASLLALSPDSPIEKAAKSRYLDLAAFRRNARIPEHALEMLWQSHGLDAADTQDVVDLLVDRALLRRDARSLLTLHDLQADYVRAKAGSLRGLHERLLASYQGLCQGSWSTGPNDAYYFENLPYHLAEAGRVTELGELLRSYRWLEAKLAATGLASMLRDYELVRDDDALDWIHTALRVSAHALSKDPGQLAGQLAGRLRHVKQLAVKALLKEVDRLRAGLWLSPVTSTMQPPRGPLVRTIDVGAGVTGVAVFADRYIVSASADHQLTVWDIDAAERVSTMSGPRGWHTGVMTIGDRYIVSYCWDNGMIAVWEPSAAAAPRMLVGHRDGVNAVVPLGADRIISASKDRTLRVWDLSTGQCLHVLEGHDFQVNDVVALPDGQVASASTDLIVWNVDTGESVRKFKVFPAMPPVDALFAVGDSRVLCVHVDSVLRFLDLRTGRFASKFEGLAPTKDVVLAVLGERRMLTEGSDPYGKHDLKLWDLQSWKRLRTLKGHNLWVNGAVALDRRHVVSGSEDGTLRLWDVDAPDASNEPSHKGWINSVAALTGKVVVSSSFDAELHLWQVGSGKILCTLRGPEEWIKATAVLHPQGVISASHGHTFRLWNAESGELVRTIDGQLHGLAAIAVLSPDQIVSVSAGFSGPTALRVWDMEQGTLVREIACLGGHALAAFSDQHVICAVDAIGHKTLELWDLHAGTLLRTFAGHRAPATAVAVVDETTFVSGSEDTTLRIWDRESGEVVRILEGHTDKVRTVAALGGGLVVSGSDDHVVRVWNINTGRTLAALTLDAAVTAVAPIAGTRKLVIGDGAGRVHIIALKGKT